LTPEREAAKQYCMKTGVTMEKSKVKQAKEGDHSFACLAFFVILKVTGTNNMTKSLYKQSTGLLYIEREV
jgi:hypothetical protein